MLPKMTISCEKQYISIIGQPFDTTEIVGREVVSLP